MCTDMELGSGQRSGGDSGRVVIVESGHCRKNECGVRIRFDLQVKSILQVYRSFYNYCRCIYEVLGCKKPAIYAPKISEIN